jgi:hypothetical protein
LENDRSKSFFRECVPNKTVKQIPTQKNIVDPVQGLGERNAVSIAQQMSGTVTGIQQTSPLRTEDGGLQEGSL